MNTRLLMICPSRGRPDRIKEMIDSFFSTKSEGTEVIVSLTPNDDRLQEYFPILKERNIRYLANDFETCEEAYNFVPTKLYKNIPYYGIVNDDHIFITPNWDNILIDAIEKGGGWGLACGEDMLTNWNIYQHPSACVIDGRVIQTLGYMNYPKFKHIGIDKAQGKFYGALGRLHHLTNVVIQHKHIWNKQAEWDKNYTETYSDESQSYGEDTLREYLLNIMPEDIRKIQSAMKGTNG